MCVCVEGVTKVTKVSYGKQRCKREREREREREGGGERDESNDLPKSANFFFFCQNWQNIFERDINVLITELTIPINISPTQLAEVHSLNRL